MLLEGQVALVTGGGRGLGKTIALALAREGADLVLAGPNRAELASAARAVMRAGRRALAITADVASATSVRRLVRRAMARFGRIDILVNNAGITGPTSPLHRVSPAEWDRVLAVNLTGAFLCARELLPHMIRRGSGSIVSISSVAGKIAYPLRSPYAASKWGLLGLSASLAHEVGSLGIRVNAVCPGPVRGERMRRVIRQRARSLGLSPRRVEADYLAASALKRMVEPEDVAKMVVYLASGAGMRITGQALNVDAGYTIR